MSIETFPREDVLTADPSTSAVELAETMAAENIGSIVIMDDDSVVGLVTDRDLTLSVIAEGQAPDEVTAEDIMDEGVVTAEKDAEIFDILQEMTDSAVRRVVAVDENDTPVSIVSYDDFVVLFARELGKLGDIAETQIPEY